MSGVLLLCLLLMHLSGHFTSFDKGGPLDIVFILSPLVVWYLGLREFKQRHNGKATFKQLWREGILISLVFGVISPFIFMLYYLLINSAILEYVARSYGLEGSTIMTVIIVDMVVQFIGAMLMGAVYSAILAFFLKSKKKR